MESDKEKPDGTVGRTESDGSTQAFIRSPTTDSDAVHSLSQELQRKNTTLERRNRALVKRVVDGERLYRRLQGKFEVLNTKLSQKNKEYWTMAKKLLHFESLSKSLDDSKTKMSTIMNWYSEKQAEVAYLKGQNAAISAANRKLVDFITILHGEQGATLPLITKTELDDMLQPVVSFGCSYPANHTDDEYKTFSADIMQQLEVIREKHRLLKEGPEQEGTDVTHQREDLAGTSNSQRSLSPTGPDVNRPSSTSPVNVNVFGPFLPPGAVALAWEGDDFRDAREENEENVIEAWIERGSDTDDTEDDVDWPEEGQGDIDAVGDDDVETEGLLILGLHYFDQDEESEQENEAETQLSITTSRGSGLENAHHPRNNSDVAPNRVESGATSSKCCIIS